MLYTTEANMAYNTYLLSLKKNSMYINDSKKHDNKNIFPFYLLIICSELLRKSGACIFE